jgi:polyisoprenoid-binding protein YceI
MQGRAACIAAFMLAAAGPTISDPEVLFVAHGSLGMRIEGKTPELTVARNGDGLDFSVRLGTLQTGIELRDRHMRDEVFEVERFPVARLHIARVRLPDGEASGMAPAELTVHGQTHPVNVAFRVRPRRGYDVTASFRMDLRDYGMKPPTYLGIAVKPDVDVSADFHLDSP